MQGTKTVWMISDHKKGHENQSLGLVQALKQHAKIRMMRLSINDLPARWCDLLWPSTDLRQSIKALPTPDLIIGAGSRTHKFLLACKRATHAPTIVLMAPARGLGAFFDRCIIPRHDQRTGSRIISTVGALNAVVPAPQRRPRSGLILIGGPSKHHGWDALELQKQIEHILKADCETQWTLSNSRRTPKNFIEAIENAFDRRLKIKRLDNCTPKWLPQQLSSIEKSWVTEDSVSMVYEAISGGARVGILPVPRKQHAARILFGIQDLIEEERIQHFKTDGPLLNKETVHPPLAEARRVATFIAQDFF